MKAISMQFSAFGKSVMAQNETRENTMFANNEEMTVKQSPVRTAVGAASAAIAGLAFAASLLLTPGAALADNECDPQVGTTPVDCGDATYGSGVTYDAVGDLFIDFTNSFRSTIGTSAGGDGIDLNATGSDSITFDSATTNTEIQNLSGMEGALLSVTTVNGNIDIATEEMDADANSPAGVTHAIYAESTGSGNIDITTTGDVIASASNNAENAIGIEAITGSGDLAITTSATVAGLQRGIVATTGTGLLTVNVNSGGTVTTRSFNGTVEMDLTSANQITVNNSGTIGDLSNNSPLAIRASGDSLVLNNNGGGIIYGAIDLSGLSDGYVFNNNANATWSFERFSSSAEAAISHLGAGTLNNAGTIIFEAEDLVMAPGTDYTGNDGVLEFEVTPGLTGQTDCTSPTVSGCLSLSGGSTAGTTLVRVVFLEALDQEPPAAANTGVVLVDVGGGSTQAEHFVLDPSSIKIVDPNGPSSPGFDTIPIYAEDPVYGAVLDMGEGVIDYALLYNPDNQQHVLAPVPQREGVEYVSFIHEALSIWHTTSDAVAGRQSALRDGGERGAWFRIIGEQTSREASPTLATHGNSFAYEQEYSLWTGAAIAGFDMTASDEHVLGFHIGYVSANADYEDGSSTTDDTIGATAGVYGGWWRNGITVDGTINANLLTLDHRFGSNPKDLEESESSIQSLGLRVEAGYRLPVLGERLYVQPLATVAYASADIKELELRDNDLSFEDATSLRTGLGLRVGGAVNDSGKLGYWATLRHWEEHEGDGRVLFEVRDGADLAVRDDLSGTFNEIDVGMSMSNQEGDLSGYLSGGAKFDKDDNNDSYDFSIGIRKNW